MRLRNVGRVRNGRAEPSTIRTSALTFSPFRTAWSGGTARMGYASVVLHFRRITFRKAAVEDEHVESPVSALRWRRIIRVGYDGNPGVGDCRNSDEPFLLPLSQRQRPQWTMRAYLALQCAALGATLSFSQSVSARGSAVGVEGLARGGRSRRGRGVWGTFERSLFVARG